MRLSLLLVLCLLSTCLHSVSAQPQAATPDSTAWQRVGLPGPASVEMPASVEASPTSTTKMPVHIANSHNVIYMAITNQIDSTKSTYSDGELNDEELDRVYEAAIKSLMGEGGTPQVLRRTPFEVAGHRGLEVKLDIPGKPNLARTKFARVLYVHRIIYLLTWRATTDHDTTDEPANRARFFNSLQVKAPAAGPEPSAARQAGRTVGRILIYVAVLAIIITLVRRFRSGTKPPRP